MNVPVTHFLDSGFAASEVHPGVFVIDGLGAVLADSLGAQGVQVAAVSAGDFDSPAVVLDDAEALHEGILRRRRLGL